MTSAKKSPAENLPVQGNVPAPLRSPSTPATTTTTTSGPNATADDFAREASEKQPGILAELWDFALHNKKWWLTPIILVMLMLAAFVLLLATPAAPFIYTLF